jgi:predicted transcriptional regulator
MFPNLAEIQGRRKRCGMTQKELASLAGVSQSLIAKLETGKAEVTYDKATRIFDALKSTSSTMGKTCRQIMSKRLIKINYTAKVSAAVTLMKKHAVSQLPVFKSNIIVGAITEGLILQELEKKKKEDVFSQQVSEIAQSVFPIVDGRTPIQNVIPLLEYSAAILVAEKGEVQGILTKSDILCSSNL